MVTVFVEAASVIRFTTDRIANDVQYVLLFLYLKRLRCKGGLNCERNFTIPGLPSMMS